MVTLHVDMHQHLLSDRYQVIEPGASDGDREDVGKETERQEGPASSALHQANERNRQMTDRMKRSHNA